MFISDRNGKVLAEFDGEIFLEENAWEIWIHDKGEKQRFVRKQLT